MKLLLVLVSLILATLNISLIIASLSSESWSKFNSSKVQTLYNCSDCDLLQEDWNFECLARLSCNNSLDPGLCSMYSSLYKASFAYLTASLLCSILFIEKLILLTFGYYIGSRVLTVGSAVGMALFHVIGTILWFGYTSAGHNCPHVSGSEIPSVCYSTGPVIAIANCVLMGITVVFFSVGFCKSEVQEEDKTVRGKFLWISIEKWGWVILFFVLAGIVLKLGSLTVQAWVKSGTFQGSLYRCKDCNEIEWMGWDCLQGTECNINPNSQKCVSYSKLHRASKRFISLEAACVILIALFLQVLTALIMGQDYGNRFMNYVRNI